MERAPRLIDVHVPADPGGIVVVLHGGANRPGNPMVSPTQLSVLRMVPIAQRVAHTAPRLAVFRLLNSVRGWDQTHTPVDDARWAMTQAQQRLGDLPVCLIGHSLGGRAAILTAGDERVRSVVALAPWVYPTDYPDGDIGDGAGGKPILFVHGSRDRIAKPANSRIVAERLAGHARVGYITVEAGQHGMLGHLRTFDGLAADFAAATLLGSDGDGVVRRVLAGENWLTV